MIDQVQETAVKGVSGLLSLDDERKKAHQSRRGSLAVLDKFGEYRVYLVTKLDAVGQ